MWMRFLQLNMNLHKPYKVGREVLWNVIKIYDVEGQLLEGIRHFIRRQVHV